METYINNILANLQSLEGDYLYGLQHEFDFNDGMEFDELADSIEGYVNHHNKIERERAKKNNTAPDLLEAESFAKALADEFTGVVDTVSKAYFELETFKMEYGDVFDYTYSTDDEE